MANSIEDKKNVSKRSTISLKNTTVGGTSGKPSSGNHNKTVEVEIKRRKSSGLAVDLKAKDSTDLYEKKVGSKTDSTGKLTDREFQERIRILQEAMKESENEEISVEKNTHAEFEVSEKYTEKQTPKETDSEEEIHLEKEETQHEKIISEEESKSKFSFSKKKEEFVKSDCPVVFKASDYSKKPSVEQKDQKTKPFARKDNYNKPKSKQPEVIVSNSSDHKNISEVETTVKRSEDFVSFEHSAKKKGTVATKPETKPKSFVQKKTDAGKKISRAVLDRVLDNDLEERTRSIASFKRAKQKLKNSLKDQDTAKVVRTVDIPDMITVSDLSNRMAVRAADVIKHLMKLGTMATLNQSIDADTAEIICSDFGHVPNRVSDSDIEKELDKIVDNPEELKHRAPIVAVMGHVDHGKTTLLDTLRKTSVAQKEAGGITQHVSAYQIESKDGRKITFIDTPGHAAFSNIRSRGAVITDIIVLVVAADDGIKDQTIEAIAHAKSNNVPIVVAINKIDKPNINIDRVKTDLMNHEIILEDFGGEILSSEISALKNINLEGLIDTILLQAEMLQLQANPNRKAVGTILDSRIAKGRGIVASAIIQHGTLKTGDVFVAGASYGRIRSLYADNGKKLNEATPSTPVEIVGFNSSPEPGDVISVMDSEQKAREIAEYRARILKEKSSSSTAISIDQLMAGQKNAKKELTIVTKADVSGSLEALIASIESISHEEVGVKVVYQGVGMINESDVDFAKNTGSVIIGFNIGATSDAKNSAQSNGIKIYSNSVIYHIIEEVKKMMSELLPPVIEENYTGKAEVRKIFVISRYGTIAGCYVTEGSIKRNDSKIKVVRSGKVVFEGKIRSMKHEKDEIKESRQSYECGILAEGFNDFVEGDFIECYEIIQKSRSVD